ncbi:MAG: hypothetical protein LH609_14525 [Rudanella sp.]|nr:hypothetical protein [Rudanella sp.]
MARLPGPTTADYVVAIEAAWFARLLRQTLYLYRFSPEPFLMIDAGAGYYIAHQPVTHESVREITDLPAELFARNVE